jgi:hypothetical protein
MAGLPQLAFLTQKISELERLAIAGKSGEVIELLRQVVPTFHPLQGSGVTPMIQAQEPLALSTKNGA